MEPITSRHNPRVKAAAQLRERRARQRQGRILIDGIREIGRALDAGVELAEVFVDPQRCESGPCRELLAALSRHGIPLVEVVPQVFEKLAYGERADGAVAVAVPPQRRLADLKLSEPVLVVVLEGVEKPGNVGAALRSADAAGVAAVIVADPATDLFNPNCIRASLGTVFSLPVVAATAAETLAWLRHENLTVYVARVDAAEDYRQTQFAPRAAIVLGSESAGLTTAWQGPGLVPIKLPMLGTADSLNVSATAAVLCYEVLRQRTIAPGE